MTRTGVARTSPVNNIRIARGTAGRSSGRKHRNARPPRPEATVHLSSRPRHRQSPDPPRQLGLRQYPRGGHGRCLLEHDEHVPCARLATCMHIGAQHTLSGLELCLQCPQSTPSESDRPQQPRCPKRQRRRGQRSPPPMATRSSSGSALDAMRHQDPSMRPSWGLLEACSLGPLERRHPWRPSRGLVWANSMEKKLSTLEEAEHI